VYGSFSVYIERCAYYKLVYDVRCFDDALTLPAVVDNSTMSSYVDTVSDAITHPDDAQDTADFLRAVAALRQLQERLEALHVDRARQLGWSWQDIADLLNVSRQAVHKKHTRGLFP
jgi:DNA-directed RNA polymerase specialized sigma24 family protein